MKELLMNKAENAKMVTLNKMVKSIDFRLFFRPYG